MNEIIYSQIFLLTLTVGVYLGAVQLRRRVNCALLHPILVSVAVLIAFVKLTGMPYEHYMRQTQIIDFLLGLSVVALGYVLHDQIYNIRGNVISIVIAIVTGSAVGHPERRADRALDGSRAGRRRVARAQIGHDGHRAVAVGQLGRHSGTDVRRRDRRRRIRRHRRTLGSAQSRRREPDRQGTGDGSRRARDGHGPRNGARRRRGSDQRTGDRPDGVATAVLVPILEKII